MDNFLAYLFATISSIGGLALFIGLPAQLIYFLLPNKYKTPKTETWSEKGWKIILGTFLICLFVVIIMGGLRFS